MKKFTKILAATVALALAFSFIGCKNNKNVSSTVIESSDKSIKCDILGTWVTKKDNISYELIIKNDGTFEMNASQSFGKRQIGISSDGSLKERQTGCETNGNWKIIDGNILSQEYTYVQGYGNVSGLPEVGYKSNKEIRPLGEDSFMMSNKTWTRK